MWESCPNQNYHLKNYVCNSEFIENLKGNLNRMKKEI